MVVMSFMVSPFWANAKGPGEEISDVVEVVCPQLAALNANGQLNAAEQDLLFRCGEVKRQGGESYDYLSDAQKDGLDHMTSMPTSSMKTYSVEIANTQVVSVAQRLTNLKGGSTGLAVNLNQQESLPIYMASLEPDTSVVSLTPDQESSLINNRWGVFINTSYLNGDKDRTDNEACFRSRSGRRNNK